MKGANTRSLMNHIESWFESPHKPTAPEKPSAIRPRAFLLRAGPNWTLGEVIDGDLSLLMSRGRISGRGP